MLTPAVWCQAQGIGADPTLSYVDPTTGKLVVGDVVPPSPPPPGYREPVHAQSTPTASATSKVLSNVPAFDWAYGCSAVSAGMLMGYYDRLDYVKMYTGPANGGVCPLDNGVWGYQECPIVASHKGIDGRQNRGHVDDYWVAADSSATDPYISGGWTEHSPLDCTADFMGTSQNKWHMPDGYTIFFNNTDGSPLYDNTGCEPWNRDGCHGMKLFAESKGYTVQTCYNQWIYGYAGNTKGFTFQQFVNEIDAGYPVLIQLEGHTMLGYGYDTSTQKIYIHNTWGHGYDTMTWGSSYSGMAHKGVTVFHLAPTVVDTPTFSPDGGSYPGPISVTVSCTTPGATIHYTTDGRKPTASDPVVANGGTVSIDKIEYLGAIAMKANMTDSAMKSAFYGPKVASPTLSLGSGAYESGATVTLGTTTSGAEVHYTTNGADPTTSDPVAIAPVILTRSCTLKAKAFKTNWVTSSTTTGSYTIYEAMSVAAAKSQADNSTVSCQDGIVTLAVPNTFFVETDDRVTGIRVNMPGHGFVPGTRLDVVGTLRTSGGERYIDAAYAYVTGTGSVAPFYLRCADLGGINWFYNSSNGSGQQGMRDGRSPNNIGLLVRTSGAFSPINSGRFAVADANGCVVECVVPAGVTIDPNWQYVSVTGVSGCESAGGGMLKRVLWIGSQDDIVSLKGASIAGRVATADGSQIVNQIIQSPHPYTSNMNTTWTFNAPVGTNRVRAHMTEVENEFFYDKLFVEDVNGALVQAFVYHSATYDVWSSWVTGSVLKIHLQTNATNNYYGFMADKFECDMTAMGIGGATVTLNPGGWTRITRGDGSYCFDGLPAGDYVVSASLPGGSTTPTGLPVHVDENERATGVDFVGSSGAGCFGGLVAQDVILTAKTDVECPHPYPANYTNTWTLSAPGALKMRAHFTQTELETGCDYLYVKNSSGATQQTYDSGTAANDVWTNWVTGSSMQLTLATNGSTNRYGFAVDKYEYEVLTPSGGVTVSVSPGGLSTVTGRDGKFTFLGLANGTYTVTPSMMGLTFSPASRSVTISGTVLQSGVDFTRN